MAELTKKIKAATMLESMVAMVIIVVCLGIGAMIFVNVLNNDKGRILLKALLLLNRQSAVIKSEKLFIDGESVEDGYTIQRTFVKYNDTENLFRMRLKALDENGKTVFERNELILTE